MSTAVAVESDVVHIARCAIHGLHGQRTECFVCGGPVDQVPMVPVEKEPHLVEVLPIERYCARRGCTTSLRGMRDDAVWCSDACRVAAYRERKAVRSRNRRRSRPGGAQISFGVAVRVLAEYFEAIEHEVDEDDYMAAAERVLTPALPARQRTTHARTRGATR